jgi:hypothetical protein
MGTLKPGVTYVYERADGVIYAREFGAAPDTRRAIGWDYKPEDDGQPSEQQEWHDYDPDC